MAGALLPCLHGGFRVLFQWTFFLLRRVLANPDRPAPPPLYSPNRDEQSGGAFKYANATNFGEIANAADGVHGNTRRGKVKSGKEKEGKKKVNENDKYHTPVTVVSYKESVRKGKKTYTWLPSC